MKVNINAKKKQNISNAYSGNRKEKQVNKKKGNNYQNFQEEKVRLK